MKGADLFLRCVKAVLALMMALMLTVPAVIAEETPSLPVDFTPGKPVDQANYLSDLEYQDPTLHVTIETGRKDNCDYWIARIKIGHPSQLRTTAAGGFENEAVMKGTFMAKRQNAVLAINGDYYSYHPFGYILRQGVVFRDKLEGTRDLLAIDEDGDFHIIAGAEAGSMTDTLNGKKLINVFHFGPGLVENGKIRNLDIGWHTMDLTHKRQRMCIAQTGPLEYFVMCCAGPARGSQGMDLWQFARLVHSMGAVTAYNLDGGDSTMLIFNGEKINDKNNKNTRTISDIIYFASAWDGN